MEPSSSPKFQLNWTDVLKVARGALIIAAGAFSIEFLTQIQTVLSGQLDFGQLEFARPIATAGIASLIETARRFFTNYR